MNRIIKFRAYGWCIATEKWKMRQWDSIQKNCMDYFCSPDKFGDYSPNKEPHKIMQFTGLKDKNGVEIYEGDVVVITMAHPDFVNKSFEVVFKDQSFGMKINVGFTSFIEYKDQMLVNRFHKNISQFIEVIGNVHEHPHLLK